MARRLGSAKTPVLTVAEVGLVIIHIRLCFKEQLPLLSCAPCVSFYTASGTAALGTRLMQRSAGDRTSEKK